MEAEQIDIRTAAAVAQLTTKEDNELAVAAQNAGLELDRAKPLLDAFQPAFVEARALIAESLKIHVTDATQVTEIKASRALRLKLRAVRIAAEKTRKELKEDALRQGKAIDGLANVLKYLIEPAESRLEEQEKFAERIEAERKAKLKAAREELIAPFGVDTTFYALDEMPEATFAQLLESSRLAHEAKLEAERKAEAARIEAERLKAEEERRIREENAKLKADQERLERERAEAERKAKAELAAAEAKAKAEREAAEAKARAERKAIEANARAGLLASEKKAKAEREAREKVEAELAERKRKEERERAEAEAARKRAAKAPDKEKLAAVADSLRGLAMPNPATPEGKKVASKIRGWLDDLAARVEDEIESL